MYQKVTRNLGKFMGTNIPRLAIRNHTYYIRYALPKSVWDLMKKKEIRYSLGTKDHREAAQKVHKESLKINMFVDFTQKLNMELKNKKVILSDTELKQVLTYRMRQIDDYFERNWTSGGNRTSFDDISLFEGKSRAEFEAKNIDPSVPGSNRSEAIDFGFLRDLSHTLLYQYLEWLKSRPDTTLSVQALVDKIKNENYSFFQLTENEENSQIQSQMLMFYRRLKELDEYARMRCQEARGEPTTYQRTPFISNMEEAVRFQKNRELTDIPTTKTPWQDIYEELVRPKRFAKKLSENRYLQKKAYLETIFALIDKKYVEQLTYEDCKTVNQLIYRVPKRWVMMNSRKPLKEILLPGDGHLDKQAMAPKTIQQHLLAFKTLLRYCRKQRIINDDLSDLIVAPVVDKISTRRDLFTSEELVKIFNPATYFLRTERKDDAKFWIPLVALFTGARLNEICQIRLEDIKTEDGVAYIQITDAHELQSLKTPQSKRRVPIHPKLKELGFMQLIEKQKRHSKNGFLFDTLRYHRKNKFGNMMSNAFRYYMRQDLKIKDPKKVFHSFRHTVKPRLRDAGVSAEFVDILCGWEGNGGTGTQSYGHRDTVPLPKLHRLISRLKYPELEPTFMVLKQKRDLRERNILIRMRDKRMSKRT